MRGLFPVVLVIGPMLLQPGVAQADPADGETVVVDVTAISLNETGRAGSVQFRAVVTHNVDVVDDRDVRNDDPEAQRRALAADEGGRSPAPALLPMLAAVGGAAWLVRHRRD